VRKILVSVLGFAAAIWLLGYGYGLYSSSQSPFARLSPTEIQQAVAADASAIDAPKEVPHDPLPDRVMGDAKAKVTLIEYASLTCPHCAHFHKDTLPKLKTEYIDKGLVKLIWRPYPFDGVALKGSVMAYCLPDSQFYPFISAVYESQEQWARASDPEAELKKIARLAGLSEAKMKECLDEKSGWAARILQNRLDADKKFNVKSTPSFLIGDDKIEGAQPFDQFKSALDAQIKAAK